MRVWLSCIPSVRSRSESPAGKPPRLPPAGALAPAVEHPAARRRISRLRSSAPRRRPSPSRRRVAGRPTFSLRRTRSRREPPGRGRHARRNRRASASLGPAERGRDADHRVVGCLRRAPVERDRARPGGLGAPEPVQCGPHVRVPCGRAARRARHDLALQVPLQATRAAAAGVQGGVPVRSPERFSYPSGAAAVAAALRERPFVRDRAPGELPVAQRRDPPGLPDLGGRVLPERRHGRLGNRPRRRREGEGVGIRRWRQHRAR